MGGSGSDPDILKPNSQSPSEVIYARVGHVEERRKIMSVMSSVERRSECRCLLPPSVCAPSSDGEVADAARLAVRGGHYQRLHASGGQRTRLGLRTLKAYLEHGPQWQCVDSRRSWGRRHALPPAGRPLPRAAEQWSLSGSVGAGSNAPSHMVSSMAPVEHRYKRYGGGYLAGIAVDMIDEGLRCYGRPRMASSLISCLAVGAIPFPTNSTQY